MKTRDMHQTEHFLTDPVDLYRCLMDARIHSSFTGSEAVIEDREQTSFTAFSGYISGMNIVLERGRKIVQTWRADEPGWPATHFSEVVFLLEPEENGTRLHLYHTAVPESSADAISRGWQEYYWEPLRVFLDR